MENPTVFLKSSPWAQENWKRRIAVQKLDDEKPNVTVGDTWQAFMVYERRPQVTPTNIIPLNLQSILSLSKILEEI